MIAEVTVSTSILCTFPILHSSYADVKPRARNCSDAGATRLAVALPFRGLGALRPALSVAGRHNTIG